MLETLKTMIQTQKPEIILSVSDDYLDHVGDESLSRYVDLTWQWHDGKGNWASLEVLGAIDDAPDEDFDIETLDYSFVDTNPHFSDDGLSEEERQELHELMDECAAGFNPLHNGCVRC